MERMTQSEANVDGNRAAFRFKKANGQENVVLDVGYSRSGKFRRSVVSDDLLCCQKKK
jgi:hypothetical protein